MSRVKTGLVILLTILILIQFIQPERNQSRQIPLQQTSRVDIPPDVQIILDNSCYDCHSNNTRYPWYSRIQPGAWLMARHIKEGKAELNFDEFANYSKRRQLSKLRAIEGSMEDGTMPLASYVFIHRNAKLSAADQERIKKWAVNTLDILKNKP